MVRNLSLVTRRRLISGVRIATLVAALAVCCAAKADESQTITLPDLTIKIPADWIVDEDEQTLLAVHSPQKGASDTFGDGLRLQVYKLEHPATVDQVLDAQLRSVDDRYKTTGSGILRESEPRIAWLALLPKSPPSSREDIAKIDYLLVNGESCYVLHCMIKTDEVDDYRSQFEEIAKSIVFTKPVAPIEKTANEEAREKARKEGGEFGGVWFRVMVAAAVGYGVAELLRRLLSFVGLKRRKEVVVEKTKVEEKQPEENLYNKPTNWPLVFAIGVAIITAVALLGRPNMPDRDFGPLTPLVKWFFNKPG